MVSYVKEYQRVHSQITLILSSFCWFKSVIIQQELNLNLNSKGLWVCLIMREDKHGEKSFLIFELKKRRFKMRLECVLGFNLCWKEMAMKIKNKEKKV